MSVEKRIIESNLPKKGFEKEETSHHTYFHYINQGKKTGIFTYVSRGGHCKTYSDNLVSQIKKQLKLDSNHQTEDLLKCPLSKEEYLNILKKKGFVV